MQLLGDQDYRRVAQHFFGQFHVSTIWLGLDHSFCSDGPPLIFETMVFGDGGPLEQERYSSEADAVRGHHEYVKLYRKKILRGV